jgi:G3E family GTPase
MSMPTLFAADNTARTPLFVLTGFLGSGKTTLLNRLLREPTLADTAVIVNELGDVALDHLLVQRLEGEVALLRTGCICCALRGDFEDTLRELLARRDEGSLPDFTRVVVETTGLADPAPLMQAVEANPLLSHHCRLGAVLTTVDAVNAPAQLVRQWEARKQVALADWLLVTMTDLVPEVVALEATLRTLNPTASLVHLAHLVAGGCVPAELLQTRPVARAVDEALGLLAGPPQGLLAGRPIGPLHGEVRSFAFEATRPLDWLRLQAWLAELRARHGEALLRLKGIVRVFDEPEPLVLHGVQHLFHPPVAAPGLAWPADRSALVVIVRGLDERALRAGFEACVG